MVSQTQKKQNIHLKINVSLYRQIEQFEKILKGCITDSCQQVVTRLWYKTYERQLLPVAISEVPRLISATNSSFRSWQIVS